MLFHLLHRKAGLELRLSYTWPHWKCVIQFWIAVADSKFKQYSDESDDSRTYTRLKTRNKHPIICPHGWTMGCILWRMWSVLLLNCIIHYKGIGLHCSVLGMNRVVKSALIWALLVPGNGLMPFGRFAVTTICWPPHNWRVDSIHITQHSHYTIMVIYRIIPIRSSGWKATPVSQFCLAYDWMCFNGALLLGTITIIRTKSGTFIGKLLLGWVLLIGTIWIPE